MRAFHFAICAVFCAVLALPAPARADQILGQGRIIESGPDAGDILFGALRLGKRQSGKTILTPDGISVGASGGYWTNTSGYGGVSNKPVNMLRFSDRVLLGLSAKWSGNYPDFTNDFHWTMGNGYFAYLPRNAQFQVINPYSQIGALFAGNTANSGALPGVSGSLCCNIPLAVQSLNDATGAARQSAWGFYGSAVRGPGAGSMVNEIDVMNAGGDIVRASSYQPGAPEGWTVGLALQAGGEGWLEHYTLGQPKPWPTNHAASTGLYIGGNGGTWDKGITIQSGSISPTTDGSTVGMELPRSHLVRWVYDISGVTGAFIDSQVSNSGNQIGLQFSDFGALFQNRGGTLFGQINFVPNTVNRPVLSASPNGSPVAFAVLGDDANIDLALQAQGAGKVTVNGPLKLAPYTVAALPACNATQQDTMAVAIDVASPTYRGALTGGGTVRTPVYCDGVSWTAH